MERRESKWKVTFKDKFRHEAWLLWGWITRYGVLMWFNIYIFRVDPNNEYNPLATGHCDIVYTFISSWFSKNSEASTSWDLKKVLHKIYRLCERSGSDHDLCEDVVRTITPLSIWWNHSSSPPCERLCIRKRTLQNLMNGYVYVSVRFGMILTSLLMLWRRLHVGLSTSEHLFRIF